MLSGIKLKQARMLGGATVDDLVRSLVRTGLNEKQARAALNNWQKNLMEPLPKSIDIKNLARALGLTPADLLVFTALHRYAPIAPRKVRLVADLVRGYMIHDALDMLKFANKRAAVFVEKVLRSALANADEQEADVERLYVCEVRVDEGGVRAGTRRWRPKDRGRAMPWTRLASHIYACLDVK